MNRMPAQQIRVLAIDPFTRGFGFVILEGPEHLVDWGMKEVRQNKAARSLKQLADLIEHYQPDVIVAKEESEVRGNYAAWGGVIEDSVKLIRCARSVRGRL